MSEKAWLSETNSPKAVIAILFGNIDDLTIEHCLSLYPKGLLIVCEESLPKRDQIQTISAKTNIHDFLKFLSEFLLIDPINPPEVKISSSIKKDEFSFYETLHNHTLNQIDTTQKPGGPERNRFYQANAGFFKSSGLSFVKITRGMERYGTKKGCRSRWCRSIFRHNSWN